jgi:hypothetical protein
MTNSRAPIHNPSRIEFITSRRQALLQRRLSFILLSFSLLPLGLQLALLHLSGTGLSFTVTEARTRAVGAKMPFCLHDKVFGRTPMTEVQTASLTSWQRTE